MDVADGSVDFNFVYVFPMGRGKGGTLEEQIREGTKRQRQGRGRQALSDIELHIQLR